MNILTARWGNGSDDDMDDWGSDDWEQMLTRSSGRRFEYSENIDDDDRDTDGSYSDDYWSDFDE